MTFNKQNLEIISPKSQLRLYGYEKYFSSFIKIYKTHKLPNAILLSGPKGLGKSTFAYHFINYLLSEDDNDGYSLRNFTINQDNQTFVNIQNNTHPNFFVLENELLDGVIKIDQVRSLIKFLNKSTYSKNIKIVLIDNAEKLNTNSSNALLKSLEEPLKNTFFFIIFNNFLKIPDTIKSRCLEFKFHFNVLDKMNIFNNLVNNYSLDSCDKIFNKFIHFETPGNLITYLFLLRNLKVDISSDYLTCITSLLNKSKNEKDFRLINFISLLVEFYYNELVLNNSENINTYSNNKNKILYLIYKAKNFNLDKKNLLISIENLLKHEAK